MEQMHHKVVYENFTMKLLDVKGFGFFEPKRYKLEPYSTSTACLDGYICNYTIENGRLLLSKLNINLNEPIPIAGCRPTEGKSLFKYEYNNLNLVMGFTGTILLGEKMIDSKFKSVLEFRFEAGQLMAKMDRSSEMLQ